MMGGKAVSFFVALLLPAVLSQVLGKDQNTLFLQQAQAEPKTAFSSWVNSFSKAYQTVEEYERRLQVWIDNLEYVLEYNAKHTSHWLGMNFFADLSLEEFRTHAFGYNASLREQKLTTTPFRYENSAAPASVDWRKKGAVSKVKNQAQCGSCWAFSATGSVEGINAIVSGELISLSEQELVDCDRERDQGCHGGLMDYAFDFIINNGGIDTEVDYPYAGHDEGCVKSKMNRKVVTIDGYEDVPANSESALKKAVANQPVSVAIEADGRSFQLYSGGVYDDVTCGTQLNHGVLIVGYNVAGAEPYWIVKNSWGPFWGDQGYIKMKMNVADAGICGIAMVASYPVKETPNPPMPGPPAPEPPTPPAPEPVKCDDSSECPADNTCCCMKDFFGYCFIWACCPLPEATCCDDHMHCCPEKLPVCDTVAGRCLASAGNITGSVEWSEKQPTITKKRSWLPWLRNSAKWPCSPFKIDIKIWSSL